MKPVLNFFWQLRGILFLFGSVVVVVVILLALGVDWPDRCREVDGVVECLDPR